MYTNGIAKVFGKICFVCIALAAIFLLIGIMLVMLGIAAEDLFWVGLRLLLAGIILLPVAFIFKIMAEIVEKLHLIAEYSKQMVAHQEKMIKVAMHTDRLLQQLLDNNNTEG